MSVEEWSAVFHNRYLSCLSKKGNIMKLLLIMVLLVVCSQTSQAGMYEKLLELKKVCDAELISVEECAAQKKSILNTNKAAKEIWYCNYAGENTEPQPFSAVNGHSFSEASSASSIVKEILDEAGLAPNFIVRPSNVPNAMASSYDGMRFIEYNPEFIHDLKTSTQTNWTVYSVMAHEIGHHLQGHTIQAGGSRPDIELEADEYSGFILAKLGANLAQSQMAMITIGSDEDSGTHPAKIPRLKAIEAGWNKGMAIKMNQTASPNQPDLSENTVEDLAQEPVLEAPAEQIYVTEFCAIEGESFLITDTDALLSYSMDYMQIGQRMTPLSDACVFDLVTADGRYCVVPTGEIYFATESPVGKCEACDEELCGGL